MGIIHSCLDEHRVFILTEGEGVRIVAAFSSFFSIIFIVLEGYALFYT
jgi:hypothetical protein